MAFFRAKPDLVPYSKGLFALLLCVSVIVDLGMYSLIDALSMTSILARTAVDYAIFFLFLQLILDSHDKKSRFIQTASAMLGVGIIISLLHIIPYAMLPSGELNEATLKMVGVFWLSLLLWRIFQIAFILKHAIEQPMSITFIMALSYVFFTILIISNAFPVKT